MEKISGTVKWFSNRKGFGFLTPTSANSPTEEAIFVHQTSIYSEGEYRTLAEGSEVEFEVETEESGKLKAINVTAPGGGSIKPPKRDRKRGPRKGKNGESGESGDDVTGEKKEVTEKDTKENEGPKPNGRKKSEKKADPKPREPPFHDVIEEDVKVLIKATGVDLGRKMTVDVALGDSRIKLGQGGYAGLANASGMVGEGTYTCDEKGQVTFTWERCLAFADGKWSSGDMEKLIKSLSLASDAIAPVGAEETAELLWGADKGDPKEALAENGFKMKSIVLTRPPGGRGGRRTGAKKEVKE